VSRVGRLPISVPSGVQVNISGTNIHVKGPKGEMRRNFSPLIGISMENGQVLITRQSDRPAERALHGTTRALLANMIQGVSSHIMAKAYTTLARGFDTRLGKPERSQSNLWLKHPVLKPAFEGTSASASTWQGLPSDRA